MQRRSYGELVVVAQAGEDVVRVEHRRLGHRLQVGAVGAHERVRADEDAERAGEAAHAADRLRAVAVEPERRRPRARPAARAGTAPGRRAPRPARRPGRRRRAAARTSCAGCSGRCRSPCRPAATSRRPRSGWRRRSRARRLRRGRSRPPRRCPRRRARASTGSSASAPPCARSPSRAGRRGRGCRARSSRPSRACSPAIVTLAGLVPCAVSAVMIVSRCSPSPRSAKYARISIRPVSSPCEPAAGCSVTAGRPATSARICCSSHISSSAPWAPSSSWCGCRCAKPGSARGALVDARVVLHRARAERVEAGVDPEVAVGEVREVAHDLVLGQLGQARRLLARERRRAPRARAARSPGRGPARRPAWLFS